MKKSVDDIFAKVLRETGAYPTFKKFMIETNSESVPGQRVQFEPNEDDMDLDDLDLDDMDLEDPTEFADASADEDAVAYGAMGDDDIEMDDFEDFTRR